MSSTKHTLQSGPNSERIATDQANGDDLVANEQSTELIGVGLTASLIGCSPALLRKWRKKGCPYGLAPTNRCHPWLYRRCDVDTTAIAYKASKAFRDNPPETLTRDGKEYYSVEKAEEYIERTGTWIRQNIPDEFIHKETVGATTLQYFDKDGLDQLKKERPLSVRANDADRIFLEDAAKRAGCSVVAIREIAKSRGLSFKNEYVLSETTGMPCWRPTLSQVELFGPVDEAAAKAMGERGEVVPIPVFVDKPEPGKPFTLIGGEEWFFHRDAKLHYGCSERVFLNRKEQDSKLEPGVKAIRVHYFCVIGDRGDRGRREYPAYRRKDIDAILDGKQEKNQSLGKNTLFARKKRAKVAKDIRAFLKILMRLLPIRVEDGRMLAHARGFRTRRRRPESDTVKYHCSYCLFRRVFTSLGLKAERSAGSNDLSLWWWCNENQSAPPLTAAEQEVTRYQQSDIYKQLLSPPQVSVATIPTPEAGAPGASSGAVPPKNDRFADLKAFALKFLKGNQQRVVLLACDNEGAVPLAILAAEFKWTMPCDGAFSSVQGQINLKLKAGKLPWFLIRQDNKATLKFVAQK